MNNGHVEFFEKLNDPFGIKMGKRDLFRKQQLMIKKNITFNLPFGRTVFRTMTKRI